MGKAITLPAGITHVPFSDLAHLIAQALWPDTGPDDYLLEYGGARVNLDGELLQAVRSGALPVKDPLTFGPHPFPHGAALKEHSVVTVDDLRAFADARGVSVIVEAQRQAAPESAPLLPKEAKAHWIALAQRMAREIIKRQQAKDLHPSQTDIADEIAAEFRASDPQIVGAGGKPLTGSSIKRHALKGISSAQGKRLSTATGRGKRGKK